MISVDLSGGLVWLGLLAIPVGVYFAFGLGAALVLGGLIAVGLGLAIHHSRAEECPVCDAQSWDTSDWSDEQVAEVRDAVIDAHPMKFRGGG